MIWSYIPDLMTPFQEVTGKNEYGNLIALKSCAALNLVHHNQMDLAGSRTLGISKLNMQEQLTFGYFDRATL